MISALAAAGLPAQRLEVEITESVLMHNTEKHTATLHRLRELGVQISMDDFGTGYSSLSYLRRFPFDKIKIDRCFISAATGHFLGHRARRRRARRQPQHDDHGRRRRDERATGKGPRARLLEMQGYLFSRPLPLAQLMPLFFSPTVRDEAAG